MIKKIPGFSDYFISDNGEVYSIAARANRGRPKQPIKKKVHKCFGYYKVQLNKYGMAHKRFVHRLVLETFVGKCPNGSQCRHLDGNRLNNNLSNLKWGTRKENQADRILHGTDNRGERHSLSKLKERDIPIIRMLAKKINKKVRKIDNGGNYAEIAKRFNVCRSTIEHVVLGSTWGWVC